MISDLQVAGIGYLMLHYAESKFGYRENINFLGFRLFDREQPELIGDRQNGYTIYFTKKAFDSEHEAIFQCAHEVIHLLSPTTREDTSYFEEGLATYFSITCLEEFSFKQNAIDNLNYIKLNFTKYFNAYHLIEQIKTPYEIVIKNIRQSNPKTHFSDLIYEQLSKYTEIPNEIIPDLIRKFY